MIPRGRSTILFRPLLSVSRTARLMPISSTQMRRANSTRPTSQPLEELYYHLLPAPENLVHWSKKVYAVSFLPTPPSSVDKSKTILGIIPAIESTTTTTSSTQDQEGMVEEEDNGPGLNDFKMNLSFLELMHDAIKKTLQDGGDEFVKAEAANRKSGWMHIHDMRNVPALGRIGDPDDIIASVMVEDGQVLADTYSKMPTYRLFTTDGPPKLTEGLARRLEEALQKARAEEESTSKS